MRLDDHRHVITLELTALDAGYRFHFRLGTVFFIRTKSRHFIPTNPTPYVNGGDDCGSHPLPSRAMHITRVNFVEI